MATSLDEFIVEVEADIKAFAAEWRAQHAIDSDRFPMELPDDNAGLWGEFFMDFMNRDKP